MHGHCSLSVSHSSPLGSQAVAEHPQVSLAVFCSKSYHTEVFGLIHQNLMPVSILNMLRCIRPACIFGEPSRRNNQRSLGQVKRPLQASLRF
jgi:hypothetical protein